MVRVSLESLLGFDGSRGPWRSAEGRAGAGAGVGVDASPRDRVEEARVAWLDWLRKTYALPKTQAFPFTATKVNAKSSRAFNSRGYAAGMYYSRALMHDKAACHALLSEGDAAFIAANVRDEDEAALGYGRLRC